MRLLDLAVKSDSLRRFFKDLPPVSTWDDAWNPILFRYRILAAWMGVFQDLRPAVRDSRVRDLADWFRPFLIAMCAWNEYNYRVSIGLPPSLGKTQGEALLEAIKLSKFADYVMSGAEDPLSAWRSEYGEFPNEGKSDT